MHVAADSIDFLRNFLLVCLKVLDPSIAVEIPFLQVQAARLIWPSQGS